MVGLRKWPLDEIASRSLWDDAFGPVKFFVSRQLGTSFAV